MAVSVVVDRFRRLVFNSIVVFGLVHDAPFQELSTGASTGAGQRHQRGSLGVDGNLVHVNRLSRHAESMRFEVFIRCTLLTGGYGTEDHQG